MKTPYILLIARAHPDPLGFARRASSQFYLKGHDVVCIETEHPEQECLLVDGMRLALEHHWSLWLKLVPGGAYERLYGDVELVRKL